MEAVVMLRLTRLAAAQMTLSDREINFVSGWNYKNHSGLQDRASLNYVPVDTCWQSGEGRRDIGHIKQPVPIGV